MDYAQRLHFHFRRAVPFAIAALPASFIALIIWRYGVDIPQWEDWLMVPVFEKLASGTFPLRDLFAQQNEYRQFFPNLLFVGLGWLTKWDLRYEMLASFVLACLISINTYRLNRHTTHDQAQRLWLFFMANVLIFSMAQYENWLQGQQVIYFVPVACVTTALVIACSKRLRTTGKCFWCAGLSVISTFSSANGFLCWLLVLPLLVGNPIGAGTRRQRWLITIAWLTALALSMKLYFHEFQNPPSLSDFTQTSFSRACFFFLSLLGSPFSLGRIALAIPIGAFLLVLFAFACRLFLHLRSDPVVAQNVLGLLMLATYSIATAVVITFGRVSFGLQYSLQNRYATYTLYLPVALVYLIPLILTTAPGRAARFVKQRQARLVPLLTMALIAVHLPVYVRDFRYVSVLRLSLLQAKACLLYGNIVQDPCSEYLYPPHPSILQPFANVLDGLGFLRPRLAREDQLRAIENQRAADYGDFLQVVEANSNDYIASGWAILPQRGEPPDLVLLAYEREDGAAYPFAIASPATERDLLSALTHNGVYGDARWSRSFSVSGLPVNPIRLSAWAFDAYTGKAYRIAGTHVVNQSTAREEK